MLYFDGYPSTETCLPRLRELLACAGAEDRLELRRVDTIEDAKRERFLGSPSVRVEVRDIGPASSSAPTTD